MPLVDMVIEGTVGTAISTMELLKNSAERIDIGQWTQPVRAYGVQEDDANALKALFAEQGFRCTINPRV